MEKRQRQQFWTLALVAAFCTPMQGLIAQNGIGYPQEDVVKVAEVMPVLKTCASLDDRTERETCTNQGMMEHVMQNLVYPTIAQEKGVEGTVFVQFTVTKKGSIGSVEMIRGPETFEKSAVTVIESLPLFMPGTNKGKAVNVQYVLPIRFALGE
jgi:TonB family protein